MATDQSPIRFYFIFPDINWGQIFYFITAQNSLVAIGSITSQWILDSIIPLVPVRGSGNIGLSPVSVVSQVVVSRPMVGVTGRVSSSGATFA